MRTALLVTTTFFVVTAANAESLRLGVLATLDGPFAATGEDAIRGVKMALDKFDGSVSGTEIELVIESSDGRPDVAVAKARKLIEQDQVDLFVGPLSGGEGLAVKEYARTLPDQTFVNGTSAAADLTLVNPVENLYRFTGDGAQWQAGLGAFAFNNRGYQEVAVIAEDYSFPYSQVAGFTIGFCGAGGKIPERFWIPVGTKDYSTIIAQIPPTVDAIYVVLGGADAVNFLSQYYQYGGKAALIGGTATVDQTVLSAKGQFQNNLVGAITAGPIADSYPDPKWRAFVARYHELFEDGFASPSFGAYTYYVNTLALLTALEVVDADLSDGQKKLRAALNTLQLETPTGTVTLDDQRQGIVTNFVSEIVEGKDGKYHLSYAAHADGVTQTLGIPRDVFLAGGTASRTHPACE
jgi:branched-chain amino acid transport system substrate-binding protein